MQSEMYPSCNTAGSDLETNRLGSGDPTVPESFAATTTQSGQSSKDPALSNPGSGMKGSHGQFRRLPDQSMSMGPCRQRARESFTLLRLREAAPAGHPDVVFFFWFFVFSSFLAGEPLGEKASARTTSEVLLSCL